MKLLIVVALLSFPVASFASESDLAQVETGEIEEIAAGSARVNAVVSGVGITDAGFQYGTTTSYGMTSTLTPHESSYTGTGFAHFQEPTAGITVGSNDDLYVDIQAMVAVFKESGVHYLDFTQTGFPKPYNQANNGLALDSQENVFFLDATQGSVLKFDTEGNFVSRFGNNGTELGNFNYPQGIAIDSEDNIYVVDSSNARIQKFSPEGDFILSFGDHVYNEGIFQFPWDIHVNEDGTFWVLDSSSLMLVNEAGEVLDEFGEFGSEPGQLFGPTSFEIDSQGNFVVLDSQNNRVQIFDSAGLHIDKFGSQGTGNGQFQNPKSLALESDGSILVSDASNFRIQRFMNTGFRTNAYLMDLQCETLYHFRAYATNTNGTAYGEDKTLTTSECSDAPLNLSGTSTVKSASLTWETQGNPERVIVGYRKLGETEWTESNISDNQSHTFAGLEPNSTYEFRVAGSNYNEVKTTKWSDIAQVVTGVQNEYIISTCQQFQAIGMDPVSKVIGDMEGKYILANNIDCAESATWEWDPITIYDTTTMDVTGFAPIWDNLNPQEYGVPTGFKGDFDGGGFTISNVTQHSSSYNAIFGILNAATISNVNFTNVQLTSDIADGYSGGLAMMTMGGNTIIDRVNINGSMTIRASQEPQKVSPDNLTDLVLGGDGNIYYTDGNIDVIQKVDPNGFLLDTFGASGTGDGQLDYPVALDIDANGNIFVLDQNLYRVTKFNSDGEFVAKWGAQGSGQGEFNYPRDLTLDSQGNVYVSDGYAQQIVKFDNDGNFVRTIGSQGNDPGQFSYPGKIEFDSLGNLFVSDSNTRYISKFDSALNYESRFGGHGNGGGLFESPDRITETLSGELLVRDSWASKTYRFDSSGLFIDEFQIQNYHDILVPLQDGNFISASYDKISIIDSTGVAIEQLSNTSAGMYVFGGIVGSPGVMDETFVTITKSVADFDLDIDFDTTNAGAIAGGIVGYGLANISDSYSTGDISILNPYLQGSGMSVPAEGPGDGIVAGSIVGIGYYSNLERVYSTGSITLDQPGFVGGLAGQIVNGSIHDSFSTSSIQGSGYVGGLVGAIGDFDNNSSWLLSESFTGNSYDVTSTSVSECAGAAMDSQSQEGELVSSDSCLKVNESGDESNYYFNRSTAIPLTNWNFGLTWKSENNELPILRAQGDVDLEELENSTSTTTTTTTNPSTTTTATTTPSTPVSAPQTAPSVPVTTTPKAPTLPSIKANIKIPKVPNLPLLTARNLGETDVLGEKVQGAVPIADWLDGISNASKKAKDKNVAGVAASASSNSSSPVSFQFVVVSAFAASVSAFFFGRWFLNRRRIMPLTVEETPHDLYK